LLEYRNTGLPDSAIHKNCMHFNLDSRVKAQGSTAISGYQVSVIGMGCIVKKAVTVNFMNCDLALICEITTSQLS